MPEGEQTPGAAASGTTTARPTGDAAVSLALASHHRNPVKIAKVMQREIDRLTALVERGATPAGAVVLTGDQAKAWTAYQALGKPEDLSALKGERDTLKTTLAERDASEKRLSAADSAAEALGWNSKATRRLVADQKLTLEMRETEVDDGKGQKVKKPMPFVLSGEGATAKAEPLADVITKEHDVYLPALTASATPTTPQPSPASRYPVTPPAPTNGGNGQGDKERASELRSTGNYAF